MEITRVKTEVLVIGGGLAGLCAALEAGKYAGKVILVAKSKAARSGNTLVTKNGLAAVLAEGYDGDSQEQHYQDTMAGGCHLNDARLVRLFVDRAGDSIRWLMKQGVPFSKDGGELLRKGAPGHSRRRFLTVYGSQAYPSRAQGMAITLPLLEKIQQTSIEVANDVLITRLVQDETGRVTGAVGLDRTDKRVWFFSAGAVVLACGGAARIYSRNTNTGDVTGDGYALAGMAGSELKHLEFIQFHPAVTISSSQVIPTSVFADGATLKNAAGKAFMADYSPAGDMATRDVMARSIFTEIRDGRGTEAGGVYLDLRGIPKSNLLQKYLPLADWLQGRNQVEVVPAAHFVMGGLVIDEQCGTTLPGLYAAGEVAAGVHGANRLAGNALTEAVVFGLQAGKSAALFAGANGQAGPAAKVALPEDYSYRAAGDEAGQELISEMRNKLRQAMTGHVGLMRDEAGLTKTANIIDSYLKELEKMTVPAYHQLLQHHQLKLMLQTARLITEAALARQDSIGAHYRQN